MSGEPTGTVQPTAEARPLVSGNTLVVEDLQTWFFTKAGVVKAVNGVSFGDYLIKRVLGLLSREMPQLKTFATLSPVTGLSDWLAKAELDDLAPAFSETDRAHLCGWAGSEILREALAALVERPEWSRDAELAERLKAPMLRLCARYLQAVRPDGRPIDAVARFHLKNGARLERINWLANVSPTGLKEALGMMVNYRYVREDIERNHEAYMEKGRMALSSEVKALLKAQR